MNISGKNIKRLRMKNHLSQKELAELMSFKGRQITAKRIADMEEGTCKVYDIDLVTLSDTLHSSIEELLKENG